MQLSKRDLALCALALSFTGSNCDELVEVLDWDATRDMLAGVGGGSGARVSW